MSKAVFDLKGSLFTLTVLYVRDIDLVALAQGLQTKVAQSPQFFEQAPVVVDLSALDSEIDFAALYRVVVQSGFVPVALRHVAVPWLEQAKAAGWAILPDAKATRATSMPNPEEQALNADTSEAQIEAEVPHTNRLVTQPVRSGQQIYVQDGDLTVTGTISAGAEVLADGSLHIYGPLRGRALAGVKGNTQARIFCQSLEAELVSIAGQYRVIEELGADVRGRAVQIYLENDHLKIEPLVK